MPRLPTIAAVQAIRPVGVAYNCQHVCCKAAHHRWRNVQDKGRGIHCMTAVQVDLHAMVLIPKQKVKQAAVLLWSCM